MKYIIDINENVMNNFRKMDWKSNAFTDDFTTLLDSVENAETFNEEEYLKQLEDSKLKDELERRVEYREAVRQDKIFPLECERDRIDKELHELKGKVENE